MTAEELLAQAERLLAEAAFTRPEVRRLCAEWQADLKRWRESSVQDALGPNSGSATSRQAALDHKPRSGTQRGKVYEALIARGEEGLTRDQVCVVTGLRESSVHPRVWELVKGGFVEETDRTRLTRAGEPATVLVATRTTLSPLPSTTPAAYDPRGDWA